MGMIQSAWVSIIVPTLLYLNQIGAQNTLMVLPARLPSTCGVFSHEWLPSWQKQLGIFSHCYSFEFRDRSLALASAAGYCPGAAGEGAGHVHRSRSGVGVVALGLRA